MRRLFITTIAAISSSALSHAAFAADMPVKAPMYAKAPVAIPYDWSGFYAGIHGGGGVLFDAGWQGGGSVDDRHGTGGLAGGQIGYNYQMGMLVTGVEAEAFWSGIGNTIDGFDETTLYSTAHVKNKSDFDIAARFGLAVDRALVYGKAGWVWGRFGWDQMDVYGDSQTASATLNGLMMGLGLEYGITQNWTAKFEYDYFGFGARNILVMPNGDLPYTQSVSADKQIFKVGVNYLFDPNRPTGANAAYGYAPGPSQSYNWTGFYAGVHGGGGVLFNAGWQANDSNRHGIGGLAGGQVGYNYQTGMLVTGLEAEGFWSGVGNTVNSFDGTTLNETDHSKNKSDFDIAARFGIAVNRALIYGKAGWVWGRFGWSENDVYGDYENANATLNGLLVGLGLEYGITQNWSAKFEYDYLGFNAKDVRVTTEDPTFTYTENMSADKHIVKVGINYLFDQGKATNASAAYAAMPSPSYNWTGFYAGVQGGGGVLFDAGWEELKADRHGVGGLAGGQVGYNYQMGRFVGGVEAEGFWSGIHNTVDSFDDNTLFLTTHVKNKSDFDVAGRFGVAMDRALVYGKAGWVWGRFGWDQMDVDGYGINANATLNGLLVGLGLEYGITQNWTTKFEYDYLGFNSKDVLTVSTPDTFFRTQNLSADKHIVKLGINYKL